MKKNFTFMKTMLVVALMSLWGFTAEAGTGTAADPYTCAELIANGNNVPAGTYVTGYVVGGRYDNFSAPWKNEYAISIADNASETDVNNCVQVKLSTAQRPQWHPKNNPAVIGKQVLASGSGNGYGGYVALENNVTIALVTTSPTITASPTSASLSAAVGATATQDITVGGGNLTADISAAVSGADASLFTISPSSLAQTSGTASGTITVTYSPTAVGNHAATLTLTSTGATDVTVALTGTAALATPTATASTGGTATGFTANWNAVAGATSYTLNVYTKESSGTLPTDLFISEYGEGSSYNKFIELYNGTGADVDLSNYSLKKESNGGGTFGSELTLSGTLANGATYVICNSSAGTTLKAKADLVTNSASTGFNGNDAIGLFKSGTMIDIVGVAASSAYWGQDKGFIRNANATAPSTTFNASADWTETAKDAWDNVGTHTMTGGTTDTPITGSPFTVTGATSKVLTGLDSTKDYYYTVVASDGTNTSAVSNEIQGVLVATSVETNTANSTHIYATNGAIQFEVVESGLQVEVYNSLGQRVISTTTVQGLNTIQVNERGVLVVRVGKELQKVIL